MRITVCAAFYPPYRGGYAESVRLLAEGLAARGHAMAVVVCDSTGLPRREMVGGVMIRRVPAWNPLFLHGSFPIPNPFIFWRELRLSHTGRADIISTQTRFFPSTLIGFLFAKAHRISTVHTERGAAHTSAERFFVRACGLAVDHTVGRLICRFSDVVIGVSDAAVAFTRQLGARATLTIHNGIDAAWWCRPNGFIRTGVFPQIIFVGRLVHAKGVQDLCIAVARLLPEFPAVSVAVVGDGPYRAALEDCARALGIAHVVVFHGAQDAAHVRNLLWESDVFVNPSHSEGFPRSVLEAAVAGVPIIATAVGGTGEIITHAAEGLLVPVGNPVAITCAIRTMLCDEALRTQSAVMARDRVEARFSIAAMVDDYEACYKKACAELQE